MDNLFLLLFLLTPIAWVVGLAKPQAFSNLFKRNLSRMKITGISLLVFITSFVGFGMTTDVTPTEVSNDQTVQEIVEVSSEDNDQAEFV